MSDNSWQAYGLIASVAQRLAEQRSLGKTKLQKIVYLLEKLKGITLGYDFSFYTYGPFSSDLAADLDYVNSLDGVQINYEPSINMYEILPGPNASRLTEKCLGFLNENKTDIDEIITRFGTRQAKELELLSTLVFVAQNRRNEEDIIRTVGELKPKFSTYEIRESLNTLRAWNYLT